MKKKSFVKQGLQERNPNPRTDVSCMNILVLLLASVLMYMQKHRNVKDVTTTHTYPFHEPDEQIVGIPGLQKALVEINGPNFVSDLHNAKFQNVRTAAVMGKFHHCRGRTVGEHPTDRDCFLYGHQGKFPHVDLSAITELLNLAYCPEFVDIGNFRTRCGQRMSLWSEGCGNKKHRTNLPGSMAKAIQEIFDGKREFIAWSELNDPRMMATRRAEQVNVLPDIKEVEEQQGQVLEEYLLTGRSDVEFDESRFAAYKIWEERKAKEQQRARTQAAMARQIDEMTWAALDPKSMGLMTKDPIAFAKVFKDEHERQRSILATKDTNSIEKPKNRRLEQLEAKRTRVGESSKKSNANARAWNGRFNQKKGKGDGEN
jgi:hypothetical protein